MLVRAPRQHFGTVADLPFAGKENQNVAARIQLRQEFHAARHALRQFFVFLRFEETVFDGKHAPFDFDDRSIGKEPGNAFRIQCGGGNDDPQVFPAGKQKFHVSEQEVDIQRTFMDFVEDDAVILEQVGIVACFGKQNAVCHELDDRLTVGMVIETDFVADFSPHWQPVSLATRRASADAAIRRGWVHPMRPVRPNPFLSAIFGSWVVFPDPVEPQTITA